MGQFVQENFLNADVLATRLRAAGISDRLAAWLSSPINATRTAVHASSLVVTLAEALRDEDAQRVISAQLSRAVDTIDVAPLAGRVVRIMIAGGHHSELFNTILSNADSYLDEHHEELRQRFESEAPRWVPGLIYGRVFDRMYAHLRGRLEGMANDPDDETRKQFEGWIAGLPDRLETDPAMRERGEHFKDEVLGSALLRDWSSMLWGKAKEGLRTQAAEPESELHQRMTDAIEAAGHRLAQDPKLQERIERVVESAARGLADQFHDELAGLVTGTIERWDGEETSTQLELLLGRDLQFIRINGTVVGLRRGAGAARHRAGAGLTQSLAQSLLKRLWKLAVVVASGAAVAALPALNASAAPLHPDARPAPARAHLAPQDVVFAATDATDGNTIVAYTRTAAGGLQQAGSYPTGGKGGILTGSVVDHLASEGSLAYDRQAGLLYAVNAGSNTISVFAVHGDRLALRQVIGSGGQFPVSIAVHGHLVYVLNALGRAGRRTGQDRRLPHRPGRLADRDRLGHRPRRGRG